MNIVILNSSEVPIYEQIENEIKRLIAQRELLPNDPLPGMRSLAKDLNVSVITTKRAYNDLERDGYIYTVSGRGSFVNSIKHEDIKSEGILKIREAAKELIKIGKLSGIDREEIFEILNEVANESFGD